MLANDNLHELIEIRHLTASAYILKMTRKGLKFNAGQHILLGEAGSIELREYSIYSSEQDDFFEVLIKEVDNGLVSKQLKQLHPGDMVQLEGPLGFFTIDTDRIAHDNFLFVATGTGIAPFHSFAKSYPSLNYQLLHGVRFAHEAYEKNEYLPQNYLLCTTAESSGDYHGRVTDYLRTHTVHPETHCYLCGNHKMIYEVFEILEKQGIPSERMHAEVYF
ncbi:MAG: FAD-binding oxidoreductase [Bacteroidales bacterium]|jgi:ferredoxin--NADP+ reductase/benzoate/toluate 1,2-dioxygenase reductase subunit|nr:FAD-binding oxidoreductase [Bacteroidales bacterium]MDD3701790.1 FAD-binding oxidoreductase [Bacteroidales bacterium]MDY0369764.1 FAD-binding oxidoreductase [Bacteroidales bacterium]